MSEDLPRDGGSKSSRSSPAAASRSSRQRPQYMTVGSGSTSANAAALMASLDTDSGYGSALPEDGLSHWDPRLTPDLPTPSYASTPGQSHATSENDRRTMASHIHQLQYNQNRVALARAIGRTMETLKGLQEMNSKWPAHYPSAPQEHQARSTRGDLRPNISHTQSSAGKIKRVNDESDIPRPSPRRAATSLGNDSSAEASGTAEKKADQDTDALITPQAVRDFSILKLDLKLQGLTQSEIAHSMDRRAIASLLDGRINQSVRHLISLRDRIEDISSKVLVTGDLNAGKSTFCNALLRRKLLPEDQQPCTSIFCEVLDARENGGIEEVHAVHKWATYSRHDESSYDVFSLLELEKIVTDNEQYNQCKVYVKDARPIDQSLLNNGVVDIALIDAPGLNADSLKTTAVFARQEEIDVVVFVVSAANHFTLSAKEFILNAAHEKAYIFIVVNGYDGIKDQQRCQRMVLEQVAKLSPRTFKESSELVHFVSSNAIPVAPALPPSRPNGQSGDGPESSSDPNGSPNDDDDHEDDEPIGKHGEPGSPPGKGKGKEKERIEDFEQLESSLRRFVLDKRARSKLAPARTYLMNVLSDLNYLAIINRDVAQSELDRIGKELTELEPAFERSKKACSEVDEKVTAAIETKCSDIYRHTRSVINSTIARVADQELGVEYPGMFSAFQYAEDIKNAMLDQISEAVTMCENDARQNVISGVSEINKLGILHVGDEYMNLTLKPETMFQKRRDALIRYVDTPVEVWDFFDVSGLWERQEKFAGTSMALTAAGVLGGRMVGAASWVDSAMGVTRIIGVKNLKNMIVPGIVATVCLSAAYMLYSIPYTLPHRLSRRIESTLAAIDYVHNNSERISRRVRFIMSRPADILRDGLKQSADKLGKRREETRQVKKQSEVARKYFANLVRESSESKRSIEAMDLEGAPGVASAYESGPML